MRHALTALLAGGLLLILLWTAAAVSFFATPDTANLRQDTPAHTARSASAVRGFLAKLDRCLLLSPAEGRYWAARGSLLQNYRHLAPAGRRDHLWEYDMAAAMVRSPSDGMPLLQLALASSKGYTQIAGYQPARAEILFAALFRRMPDYAYARLRYAEHLHARALAAGPGRAALVERMCRIYGQALTSLSDTSAHLVQNWHATQAYHDCISLSDSYDTIRDLRPRTQRQWHLLGREVGARGDEFWQGVWPGIQADLRERREPLASYFGLSQGLVDSKQYQAAKLVLETYVAQAPADLKGWESLVRLLSSHQGAFGGEVVAEALRHAASALPGTLSQFDSGLYLMSRCCHIRQQALAELYFSRLQPLEPDNPNVYAALARCRQIADRMDQAIALFRKAISLSKDPYALHLELGQAYLRVKSYNLALEQLNMAMALRPDDPRARQEVKRLETWAMRGY